MPPPGKSRHLKKEKPNFLVNFYTNYINYEYGKSLLTDPSKLPIVSGFILLGELFLNLFIVHYVKYTEIDWIAYMQECEGFINGTTNYSLLKGDTGPLVYPAGFVYIYTLFYYISSRGANIRLVQYIFIVIYLLQMYLVLRVYNKSRKVPPYMMLVMAFTSYRIHSIYVLRLFNDPIAILFLYLAINMFIDGRWSLGSLFFSVGVSIKMNILLFAPAILLIYIVNLGYFNTIKQLIICGSVQLILGAPFLLTYPIEYVKSSFDVGRIFEHKWTVNYRFLPREFFEHKIFHIVLLCLHISLLLLFLKPCYKYVQSYCRLRHLQMQLQPQIDAKNAEVRHKRKKKAIRTEELNDDLSEEQQNFLNKFESSFKQTGAKKIEMPENLDNHSESQQTYAIYFDKCVQLLILPIFLANFIGVVCARSLHYQFYIWYFHSLPYVVWYTEYNFRIKFLLLGLIELAWNTYPSTNISSFMLHVCHFVILYGIGRTMFKIDKTVIKNK